MLTEKPILWNKDMQTQKLMIKSQDKQDGILSSWLAGGGGVEGRGGVDGSNKNMAFLNCICSILYLLS